MKFLIDTDMGIDDAVALLMVLAHPEAEIKAITSLAGNVSLAQATHNVGVVLDVANAPPMPIYQGCARALLPHQPHNALEIHGPDGLGGAGKTKTTRPVETEHASLALTRLARENPGQLTLLTLGPLTNVALAIRLDPAFLKNLKQIVVMGGAVDGRGNTSATAEFNIFADPEAAKITFKASSTAGMSISLISWETTLAYGLPFENWDRLIDGTSAAAQFTQKITAFIKPVMAAFNSPVLLWPDPLAAAVALAPDIVLSQEHRFVEVETAQNLAYGLTHGQTIVDYRPNSNIPPNTHIVREVDMQKFQDLVKLAMQ